jgi:hypothetical protein
LYTNVSLAEIDDREVADPEGQHQEDAETAHQPRRSI